VLTRTTTQLLNSLLEPDNQDVWHQFDARYRPVLEGFARTLGLSDEDASEAAQVTLAQFASDYRAGRYDRDRGRLSSYLMGIARNRITDIARVRQRNAHLGDTVLSSVPDDVTVTQAWATSQRRVVFSRALDMLMRDTRLGADTIKAFEYCAIRNVAPEVAAQECGMSVAQVYVAKNRAIKKLRELVAEITMEFDEQ
jgi:RNA polymerase sigma-70 factor, ECF subfamily